MTQEEKAKRYDEAIERAKKHYEECKMRGNDWFVEDIEDMFPELKESEDERIRKAIVELVHDTTGDSLWVDYGVHKEDALAWLEKQGEQKQDVNIQINPSEYINDMGGNGCYLKNTVQKPAWSEEDERQCNNIISLVEGKAIMRKDIKGFVNWLKSIKNKFLKLNKWNEEDEVLIEPIIEFLETGDIYNTTISSMTLWLKSLKDKVQPQPKQERSEEDKKILDRVITNYESGYLPSVEKRDEIIKKLESFKERYIWKPSEEQIDALEDAIADAVSSIQKNMLNSLYIDLKKL